MLPLPDSPEHTSTAAVRAAHNVSLLRGEQGSLSPFWMLDVPEASVVGLDTPCPELHKPACTVEAPRRNPWITTKSKNTHLQLLLRSIL